MSDTSYPVYQHYGTNAQRTAFTPTPSGGQPVYIWYESDTGNTYLYSTGWHQIANTGGVGKIVQVVNTEPTTSATGTTVMPYDNTIPQKTEGDEYMTLAITPSSSTNKLRIDVILYGGVGAATQFPSAALFQDTANDALAAGGVFQNTSTGTMCIAFTHYMTAGTTSSTTFKVRAGGQSGTFTFNGSGGTRTFGGVTQSSITITEITV